MPAQRSRTVPAHRCRASSPWPPSSSPWPPSLSLPPSSPLPPSSSPRRSPSPLPRASSPNFPAYVMLGPEAEKALCKEQEPRRKQLNRKIVRLQKELASAPDNTVLKAKTTFQWTCHPESDENNFEDIILNYRRGRSFKDALEGFGITASKDAGILPAALFYGSPAPAAV
ncbi:hypothetical protein B0H16DRAFT_1484263 [Mycena metata]|uniref:Uncharacterized protein n=1 Tax=Mycena metata TaxID=1033252 RepID=A0AAD7DT60_9AGAR|nr:hypothetical protein B0H16DRAFT_1484263 [Mycena metata]